MRPERQPMLAEGMNERMVWTQTRHHIGTKQLQSPTVSLRVCARACSSWAGDDRSPTQWQTIGLLETQALGTQPCAWRRRRSDDDAEPRRVPSPSGVVRVFASSVSIPKGFFECLNARLFLRFAATQNESPMEDCSSDLHRLAIEKMVGPLC